MSRCVGRVLDYGNFMVSCFLLLFPLAAYPAFKMKIPKSDAIFRESFLRIVNRARTIQCSNGGVNDRWLITGGWAMSQLMMMDRDLNDIDILADGPLAPMEESGKVRSELRKDLFKTKIKPYWFYKRGPRGWKENHVIEDGQVTVPYDYTGKELAKHPRSRILAQIDESNLPFANRDDLILTKARSFFDEKRSETAKAKDAKDLASLASLLQPLTFEGYIEEEATAYKEEVAEKLKRMALVTKLREKELRAKLELH